MPGNPKGLEELAPATFRVYREALDVLQASGVPFLVGGAYAFAWYTGIARHTKDLDIFVRARDSRAALAVLAEAGFQTEITFAHWLGKACRGEDFLDIIFGSGNGLCAVDGAWFEHAVECEVLGAPARLVPAEEMVWQKAYIMERERFDGADVLHLLLARGAALDWDRLLARFGAHWRILLSHLVLFDFVYPQETKCVPPDVLRTLINRLNEGPMPVASPGPVCQGTLLSRTQYRPDIEEWGYQDARLPFLGKMTPEQVELWTDAGGR